MDRSTDWPWSWEEEVEWKADLEERDYDFLEGLIDDLVEDSTSGLRYVPDPSPEQTADDDVPEEFSVTA
jgi:hypothetical protein